MLIPTWDYAMGQVRRQAWVLMHERGYTSSRTVILEPCLFVSMKAEPATVNSRTRTWNPLLWNGSQTSCRRAAATICPRPGLQVVTRYTSCTHMDRSPLPYVHVGLPVPLTKVAWWPWVLDLESGVRGTCNVGYLCINFGLPRPLCSRLRPDVSDR